MYHLQNASLLLEIDPQKGLFSVLPVDARFTKIQNARLGYTYSLDRRTIRSSFVNWRVENIHEQVVHTIEHGELQQIVFSLLQDDNGIGLTFTFAIPREYPLLMWKIGISNHGSRNVEIQRIEMLRIDKKSGGEVKYPLAVHPAELGFFSNGWQSWSPSRWYRGETRMNISRLVRFQRPMLYNPGTPLPMRKGVFSSDMFAILGDLSANTGFLAGFLSQKNHFGSIFADLNSGQLEMWANGDGARLEPGMEIATDWAVFTPMLLDHRAPLEAYLEGAARENHVRVPYETPVGWCSWYQFYTEVTSKNIEDNLQVILNHQEKLPIDLVQIDDGYQKRVGDWLEFQPTFPDGVKPLADSIGKAGLIPGLWQAPFIVHPRSDLVRDHPDWILRDENGKPVNAGFGWNSFTTGLDLTVPEALAYTEEVVRTASKKWGFPYLKLDFLYAAALKGKYRDSTKTRAQVMRAGMEALRNAVGPEVTLLGCGAPLGSVLGLVDAMRIGPDVSGDWLPSFNGIKSIFRDEPSMPSARNSIRSIITRASFNHRWWVIDPDCLLVRPDTRLSIDEIRTLSTVIGLTGGSLLLSDDLPALPAERMCLAEVLLPVISEEVRVLDWFTSGMPSRLRVDMVNEMGGWHILGGFNWSDATAAVRVSPADYRLEDGEYVFREFWSGIHGKLDWKKPFEFPGVPAHGCVLMAVRRLVKQTVQYLGSDLHFSQGVEVAGWREDKQTIEINLRLPRMASGNIYIRAPQKPEAVSTNGNAVKLVSLSDDHYSLPVQVEGFCAVKIEK